LLKFTKSAKIHSVNKLERARIAISSNTHIRINGEIRYPEVRVIGANGEQLGIMSSRDAQLMARDTGADLVEISASANPPVVKIIDWGKYQYQKMKEQNRAKKKSKSSELKQIRLGLKIGENDLNIKIRKIKEFLNDGNRVKIMVVFRGREMAHKEIGEELVGKIINLLSADAIVENKAQMNGRNLSFSVRRK
jgi:translation initiation factor IF-3